MLAHPLALRSASRAPQSDRNGLEEKKIRLRSNILGAFPKEGKHLAAVQRPIELNFRASTASPWIGRSSANEALLFTLARSCSTTELHPHPNDWRRSFAGNGRAMPNAAYECNSRHEGRNGPKIPISPDMSRNRPETAGERPLARPATGTFAEPPDQQAVRRFGHPGGRGAARSRLKFPAKPPIR